MSASVTPREAIAAAEYLGTELDLSNATMGELVELVTVARIAGLEL